MSGVEASRVLVTGGTGRVGTHLVRALIEAGIRLRVFGPDAPASHPLVEWECGDFMGDVDYDQLVCGCSAVLHLGAELFRIERMVRVNHYATQKLVASC